MDPLDILVISPGPDNCEISVGGTIVVSLRQKLHVGAPELAVQEPDLMRLDLQASVAALVNVQNVEAIDVELMWRAVTRN